MTQFVQHIALVFIFPDATALAAMIRAIIRATTAMMFFMLQILSEESSPEARVVTRYVPQKNKEITLDYFKAKSEEILNYNKKETRYKM